jgi:DNA polymerase III delta subunit
MFDESTRGETIMSEPILRLFTGDPYRCERALAAREAALHAQDPELERHVHFADEVQTGTLELALTSLSLFALGRHFIVRRVEKVRAPKSFVSLLEGSFADGTYLTLIATDLRATSPIAKAATARDALVSLPPPRGNAIRGTAKEILAEHGVDLPGPAFHEFLHRCGNDLLTIAQETDKLRVLSSKGPIDVETVERTVYPSAERTVYPFYDRLGEGKLSEALTELGGLREDPGRILGGILRHLTRLVMIRLLLDRRTPRSEMAPSVGVQDWLLRRLIGQAQRRSVTELTASLQLGVDLDRQIKSGLVRPADALMSLVLTAAGPPATRRSLRRVLG